MTNPNTNTKPQETIKLPNTSYPFISNSEGEKDDSYSANMNALAFSNSGFYPFTKMGLWHGGTHFTEAALGQFKSKHGIRCIADGELVAFRLDSKLIEDDLGSKFSSSFFLVRHKFEYPVGNKATFFSLYMHTAPKDSYPSVYKSTHIATKNASIRKGFTSKSEKLSNTYLKANTKFKAGKTDGNRTEILAIESKPIKGLQTVWVEAIKEISGQSQSTSRMQVTEDTPLDKVVVLPKPVKVKAGEQLGLLGEYNIKDTKNREMLHLEVFTGDDLEAFAKKAKAELALNKKDAPSRNFLHVAEGDPLNYPEDKEETIVHKSVGANLRQAYSKSDKKYADSPTLYPKGTALELGTTTKNKRTEVLKINGKAVDGVWTIHNNYFKTTTSKTFTHTGIKSNAEASLNLSDLDTVETDSKGKKWWKVALKKGDEVTEGYVSEDNLTHGVTFPCANFVNEPSKDNLSIYDDIVGYFKGKFDPSENDLRPEHFKLSGTLKSVFEKIDTDGDGELETEELKRAMNNKELRQQLSRMVIKHPTEWKWNEAKWGQLDGIFSTDEAIARWENEKFRIDTLCFWKDVQGKIEGFPKTDTVWHMHPVSFVGNFEGSFQELIWMKKVIQLHGNATAEAFRRKVIEVSNDLGFDPNDLMACIHLETGGTFSPKTKSPLSTATGLIQFMSATAKQLGTTTAILAAMSHVEQLEYVKKYFIMKSKELKVPTSKWGLVDLYLSIFWPVGVKKQMNDVLIHEGMRSYKVNKYHDVNKDGKIKKSEIAHNVQKHYDKGIRYKG